MSELEICMCSVLEGTVGSISVRRRKQGKLAEIQLQQRSGFFCAEPWGCITLQCCWQVKEESHSIFISTNHRIRAGTKWPQVMICLGWDGLVPVAVHNRVCGWGKSAFLLESVSVGYGSTCCPHQHAWTLAVKPAQLSAFSKHLQLPLFQLWQAMPLMRHCLPWLGLLSDVASRFQTLLYPPLKQLWEHVEKAEGGLLSEILQKCQGWLSPLFLN